MGAATGRLAMAAAAHPGGWVRDPAEHSGVLARDRPLPVGLWLLPAGSVGRLRRVVRIHRPGSRTGRSPAAPEARVGKMPSRADVAALYLRPSDMLVFVQMAPDIATALYHTGIDP